MTTHKNIKIAIDLFDMLCDRNSYKSNEVWKAFSQLLLTCEIFLSKRTGWEPLRDVVVYRESNDFPLPSEQSNTVVERAEKLSAFLASQLGCNRVEICSKIALYWRHKDILAFQPNNLVGNAFRSLIAHSLKRFGDPEIEIEEEVNPFIEFPGFPFSSRSKTPRIDIVLRRKKLTVALISARWRFRHDRVDVVEEANSYLPAARRHNPNCQFYAVVGEFSPPRLAKILSNSPPEMPFGSISACVHFAPELLWEGLGENGRTKNLKSLDWLIDQSRVWK